MRRALVTGSTGFIGTWLTRDLVKKGIEVYALVRRGSGKLASLSELDARVVECDMREYSELPDIIKARDIDAVFHIAWNGVTGVNARDQLVQLKNVQHTLDLVDSARRMDIPTFVGAGSLHELEAMVEMSYDKVVTNLGLMYKTAKLAAHWMAKAKAGAYGLRFFWPLINTYGEGEESPRLINSVIRSVYKGESPALSQGSQIYDFVHVEDVARAMRYIAESGIDGSNYTIESGEGKPLREYLEVVGRIANEVRGGDSVPLGFGALPSSQVVCLDRSVFDTEELKKHTGFKPRISFDEGVYRTAIWIRDHAEKA